MTELGLHCCTQAFSSCLVGASRGYYVAAVCRLLIEVASLIVEHWLWGVGTSVVVDICSVVVAPGLKSSVSIVVVHRLSCPEARGIFLDQGSTHVPCISRQSLIHCLTRKVLCHCFDKPLRTFVELPGP